MGPEGIQSILTVLLLQRLMDKGGDSNGLDKDTLLLLLVAGAGQQQMVQSGTEGANQAGGGWDLSNPLTLLALMELLKSGPEEKGSALNGAALDNNVARQSDSQE
jgi:hypothetical protein